MLLDKLCNSISPSGYEGEIRKIIKSEIDKLNLNFSIDKMGNILVHKNMNKAEKTQKVMLSAHMDECGLIITSYNSDGTLKFSTLGYIDKNTLPCKTVVIGEKKINGVIGLKPIHLQNAEEAEHGVCLDELCIDIGASCESEARNMVSLGDFAVFNIRFEKFSDNIVKSKALDNRIGCYVLLNLLKENYNCDLYVSFNVQGNIENRGVNVSAYNIKPDIIVLIDTICSDDSMSVDLETNYIQIGKGPVIPFKFGNCVFNRDVVQFIRKTANKLNIPYQKIGCSKIDRKSVSMQISSFRSKMSAVLIPCRYMNSVVSICDIYDCKNTIDILKSYLKNL